MTDNAHKKPDAEVLNMEELAAASLASNPARGDKQGGAGVVWFLAFALLVGGGTYAAWPYIGSTVMPVLRDAQAQLGLQSRPTQPTMPSSALQDEAPAPVPAPDSAPISAPAPVAAPAPVVESAPDLAVKIPSPEPLAQKPVEKKSDDVLPVMTVSTAFERRLNERMDALEDQLKAATAVNKTTKDDESGKLSAVIAELRDEVQALNARLKRLESVPRGRVDPSASAQALVLSVTQLATQAEGSQPFSDALVALERIGGTAPMVAAAIESLRAPAATGVPTQETLTAQFNRVAGDVMKVHNQSQRSGWWGEVQRALSGLVSVRQTDPARIEDDVERALAVAEQALGKKDLKTAVAAVALLEGVEADALRPWRDAAWARVNIQDALQALHNHALAALAATGGA